MGRNKPGRGPKNETAGADRRGTIAESVNMGNVIRGGGTGGGGQVAYAMLGRLASGEVFGPNTKVILQLLEITPALPGLEGVAMELNDCSFATLQDVVVTDDPNKAFKDCNWALLVGGFPRKQGME